jgi:hypothetical protein
VQACPGAVDAYHREPITLPVKSVDRLLEMEDVLPADERALNAVAKV